MKSIEFYYDYGSPTAYLAWTQLIKADSSLFKIIYNPVLLGGIFAATNNRSPVHVEAKAKWMWGDLKMYANKYNVDFNKNDAFPVNTLYLMRDHYHFHRKRNDSVSWTEKENSISSRDYFDRRFLEIDA